MTEPRSLALPGHEQSTLLAQQWRLVSFPPKDVRYVMYFTKDDLAGELRHDLVSTYPVPGRKRSQRDVRRAEPESGSRRPHL